MGTGYKFVDSNGHPLKRSFDDWMKGAASYATTNYPAWDSGEVEKFSSDIAWQMEGMILSPEALEGAVDDWHSGRNHYHAVAKS